jgi:hypothetical protein
MPRTTIVIVGASFAGLQIAHGLLKDLSGQVKVVLINPSSKWYFSIASPRIMAKPDAFKPEQYHIPIEQGFAKYPKGSFELTIGTATMIDASKKIVTVSGSTTLLVQHSGTGCRLLVYRSLGVNILVTYAIDSYHYVSLPICIPPHKR